jgi:hypothetical protein
MTVQYWVAKHVDDPFRNEPRNVGVIVATERDMIGKFAAEREDGVIDRRRLGQRFKYPEVYLQWIDYWRREIRSRNIEGMKRYATTNFFVVDEGEVTDTGDDPLSSVADFLFTLLVSDAGPMEAFGLALEEDPVRDLGSEISDAFAGLNLLRDTATFGVPHPIVREARVPGEHAVHVPSFIQRNGHLNIYEPIDFGVKKQKLIRDRAGWMAYMFSDIKHAEGGTAEAYSIVRHADEHSEAIDYARAMLGGESALVNWADTNERNRFLNERQRIAEHLGDGNALLIGPEHRGP